MWLNLGNMQMTVWSELPRGKEEKNQHNMYWAEHTWKRSHFLFLQFLSRRPRSRVGFDDLESNLNTFLNLWSPPPGTLASWLYWSSSDKSWSLELCFLNLVGRGGREAPTQVTVNLTFACEERWAPTINNAATSALESGAHVVLAASCNFLMLNASGRESQRHSDFKFNPSLVPWMTKCSWKSPYISWDVLKFSNFQRKFKPLGEAT